MTGLAETLVTVVAFILIALWPILVIVTLLGVTEYDARRHLKIPTNPHLNRAGVFCSAPFRFYVNSAVEVGIFLKINKLFYRLFYK
jgi:hypothetical protein